MPTSIWFNGRTIATPGSYSRVDASGLEQVGLSAAGIVAVLGTAEGGIPVDSITELSEIIRITRPETARDVFRSGQLREVADLLFAPGADPNIFGGAVEIVAMKVNPATASTGSLSNTYGDALDLTSADYGAFTSQVNVSIADGTSQGKLLTITFEDTVESVDDLGGDNIFTCTYQKPTGGWDTMTMNVEAGGHVVAAGTRSQAGLDSQITAQPAGASVMTVVSAAADTNQVTIYGLSSGAAVKEVITLTGTTPVDGSTSFDAGGILGISIAGTTTGTVTISDDDPATIATITAGANKTAGMGVCNACYAAGAMSVVADGATTKVMLLVGAAANGAAQLEKITLTGATAVTGTATWSEITHLAVGDVEAARTLTLSGEAGRTNGANQDTISKIADYYNARGYGASPKYGFTFTKVTGLLNFDPDNLDVTNGAGGAVDCLNPAVPGFKADLWAIIDWITNNSQLITAARATGAIGGAPSNTTAPVFLSGGYENMASPDPNPVAFADWQAALNLLKEVQVNTIVVLTHDPAVHAAVKAHCEYMGGAGKDERDAVVGLMNAAGTDVASKTEIKSQITDLNSRHIRATAQAIKRYNTSGELQEFEPFYQAALIAGMQAGSSVGESLTFKYANALSLRQSSTWSPVNDTEEMINAGLCFMEAIEGSGRRVVRNLTTYLVDNNIAYVEASVNEAVNYAVKNFRTNLEYAVGRRGFSGTVNATKGVAIGTLGILKDEGVLVSHRSLDIILTSDVLDVSVEMAPITPINFVKIVTHLVSTTITA